MKTQTLVIAFATLFISLAGCNAKYNFTGSNPNGQLVTVSSSNNPPPDNGPGGSTTSSPGAGPGSSSPGAGPGAGPGSSSPGIGIGVGPGPGSSSPGVGPGSSSPGAGPGSSCPGAGPGSGSGDDDLNLCILVDSGKSERIAYIDGSLQEQTGAPEDVCMSTNACMNIITQHFMVKQVFTEPCSGLLHHEAVYLDDNKIQMLIDTLNGH